MVAGRSRRRRCDRSVEQELEAALRDPAAGRGWGDERREVQCQNCQAISVFVDGRVAQRCDFCGSPSIIAHEEHQDAITPQSILAFKYSDGQIREAIRKWYGSRWFAPNRLKSAALTDTLHGVYLPYWTFDAHVSAPTGAPTRGHYYYETQSVAQRQRRDGDATGAAGPLGAGRRQPRALLRRRAGSGNPGRASGAAAPDRAVSRP